MNDNHRTSLPGAVFGHPDFDNHEDVLFCCDQRRGLFAIVAIHDTRLGPALGGCRMWRFADADDALTDALRLSRGMTYKNALAGLDLGGGKAVVIADARTEKTRALLEAFGEAVERLCGRYLTAEDVGMTPADMEVIASRTRFVPGVGPHAIGDPSPYTAIGVFSGIQAACAYRFGSPDLFGRHVVVKGVGHVGFRVAEFLAGAGARLTVADVQPEAVRRAAERLGADIVEVRRAHRVEADVYCPCALGAGLNETTIPQLAAPIVAGAANNQLATPEDGERLRHRKILYAPDYAINAGGVISIVVGRSDDHDREAIRRCEAIGDTLLAIFRRADADGLGTAAVADAMVEERLAAASAPRTAAPEPRP